MKQYIFTKSGSIVTITKELIDKYYGKPLIEVTRIDSGKKMIVPKCALQEIKNV